MDLRELLGEGYHEGMTEAEINTLLAERKFVDLGTGNYVDKNKAMGFEKRAKEAEKKLQDRLTDDEKREAEEAKRDAYVKSLEKEVNKAKYTKKLGMSIKDDALVDQLSELYANGEYEKAIDMQNEYLTKERGELEKRIKSDLMKTNPTINTGGSAPAKTKDEIMSIKDSSQRLQEIQNNIDLFK